MTCPTNDMPNVLHPTCVLGHTECAIGQYIGAGRADRCSHVPDRTHVTV